MKTKDAKEYLEECRNADGIFNEVDVIELIICAYDEGYEDGIADYKEEQDPTDESEWRKSR